MTTGYDHAADGFEYPTDPDADLPVHVSTEQTWPPPVAPVFAAPAPPVSQPVPEYAAPAPSYAAPAAPAASVAPVAPAPHEDITALIGFDPDAAVTPAATAAPAATAYVAPQPQRAPMSVSVEDPRGQFAQHGDGAASLLPAAPAGHPTGRPAIERLLLGLVTNGGSDMHLDHGEVPRYRVSGALLDVAGEPVMETATIEQMLKEVLTPSQWAAFQRPISDGGGDLDAAYAMNEADGAAITVRFRVNVYRSMEQTGAVFRVIPTKIVTLDELGVLPQVKTLAQRPRGLILFCGPTGSGKSTSMAGLVDEINETRAERIFTLEDPIEFTHRSKKSLISHREVGTDTGSFLEGLKRVRRQDPDVILIGEMRDYETIGAAIEAADTGHLVIATLHTNSAPDTISRIINSFPAERQEQIRITLAETLLAVICQVLVPSPASPRGRVVAQEIMMVTPGIANNIRENDIPAIKNALTDRETGSISLDAHLVELIRSNKITRKEAMKKASSAENLRRQLGEG